jgi:glycosyltransferase involved in cell wall biosynthesis
MPKISIIIPALNEEKNLPRLLECLKDQTFKDFEIIIADAGSKDKTKAIALTYGAKVIPGGLPTVGRNIGAKTAQGEWLLFLDADILVAKKFLKNMIEEAEAENADVVSCGVIPLSDKVIDALLHDFVNAYISVTQYFYPHAPGACIMIKRTLHEKIKGFDESIRLAEDHNYVSRAKKNGKFKILKEPKIYVSVRRLDSDGRFNISAKYVMCEVYRVLLGEIRSDIFKYKFGEFDTKKKQFVKAKEIGGKIKKGLTKIKTALNKEINI